MSWNLKGPPLRDSNLEFKDDARASANGGAHFVEGVRQQDQPPLVLEGDLTAKISPGSCCEGPRILQGRPLISSNPQHCPLPRDLKSTYNSLISCMGEGWLVQPQPLLPVSECTTPALERWWHSARLRPHLSGQSGATFSCALLSCPPPPVSMETFRVSIPGLGALVRCCGAAAIVCVDGVIWSSPSPSEAP